MTARHLLFAVMTTAYVLVAVPFEERDLVRAYSESYTTYREQVSMLFRYACEKDNELFRHRNSFEIELDGGPFLPRVGARIDFCVRNVGARGLFSGDRN